MRKTAEIFYGFSQFYKEDYLNGKLLFLILFFRVYARLRHVVNNDIGFARKTFRASVQIRGLAFQVADFVVNCRRFRIFFAHNFIQFVNARFQFVYGVEYALQHTRIVSLRSRYRLNFFRSAALSRWNVHRDVFGCVADNLFVIVINRVKCVYERVKVFLARTAHSVHNCQRFFVAILRRVHNLVKFRVHNVWHNHSPSFLSFFFGKTPNSLNTLSGMPFFILSILLACVVTNSILLPPPPPLHSSILAFVRSK
nr:MAG TPA: hypothetical protein [Caudoviricetes sp.]